MAEGPLDQVDLEGGERSLRAWAVEPTRADGSADRPGWLVLTSRRLAFFRRSGLFGPGRLEKPPSYSWRLEAIGSIAPRRFEMKIGYGDRLEIPGISVDGQGFRLNRETPAKAVLDELGNARRSRRSELGLPML
jgi:hypothetical protein